MTIPPHAVEQDRTVDRGPTYELMNALRLLAASAVVLGHVRSVILVDRYPGLSIIQVLVYVMSGFGHQAVIVFFVLSGFWISKVVVERGRDPGFWRDYLIARGARLWTVLVPALVVGGLFDALGMLGLDGAIYRGITGTTALSTPIHLDWLTGLGNLAFGMTLAVPVFGSNGPLWSLAYEFWYYMWFPALWLAIRHRRPTAALFTLAVGLLSGSLVAGFVSWLMGTVLYFALQREICSRRTGWLALVLGLGLAAVALALGQIIGPERVDPLLSVGFALTLYGHATAGLGLPRWWKPLARYGHRSSFSLYAIHFPALSLIATITVDRRIVPDTSGLALLAATFFGLVAIGWLFSLATERHTERVRMILQNTWRDQTAPDGKTAKRS